MNIKKAFSALAALTLSLGLFTAGTAKAEAPGSGIYGGITCQTYTTGTKYPAPRFFLTCLLTGDTPDVPTQTKNGRFGVLSGEPVNVRTRLQSYPAKIYLFWNYADYEAWWSGAGLTPSNDVSSYGFSSVGTSDAYTIVFMENRDGIARPLDIVDEVIAHEAGHHLDNSWAKDVLIFPDAPKASVTQTQIWADLLKHDQFLMNYKFKGANKKTKVKPCGGGGALLNLYDENRGTTTLPSGEVVKGQYVCDGNKLREFNLGTNIPGVPGVATGYQEAYDGNNDQFLGYNYAVLRYVDPRFNNEEEIFANTFAVVSGNRANFHHGFMTMTRMIDAKFGCTTALVSSLRLRDAQPPNGYTTNCERSFVGIQEVPDDE